MRTGNTIAPPRRVCSTPSRLAVTFTDPKDGLSPPEWWERLPHEYCPMCGESGDVWGHTLKDGMNEKHRLCSRCGAAFEYNTLPEVAAGHWMEMIQQLRAGKGVLPTVLPFHARGTHELDIGKGEPVL